MTNVRFHSIPRHITDGWQKNISSILREKGIAQIFNIIDVYDLKQQKHQFQAGEPNERLCIYLNASFSEYDLHGVTKINDIPFNEGIILMKPRPLYDDVQYIESTEGHIIAEYNPNTEEINILVDMFNRATEARVNIFSYIIDKIHEQTWKRTINRNSWKYTNDLEDLKNRIKEGVGGRLDRIIEEDKNEMRHLERNLEDWRRKLKEVHDRLSLIRQRIEQHEQGQSAVHEQLMKDLELISQLDKVKDIRYENGDFHIYTEDLYMYTRKNERFYLGQMVIKISLNRGNVYFQNLNNPREGYWTSQDPHPHINGDNQQACLGNVDVTIAELLSRNEIYALTLICIDYLENANIDDPAGKRVYSWDMVDEEGRIIREGTEYVDDDIDDEYFVCDDCDEEYRELDSDTHLVFTQYDYETDSLYDEMIVCDDCFDEHYTYNERLNEFVHVDLDIPEREDD